jgi:hypothetical protein
VIIDDATSGGGGGAGGIHEEEELMGFEEEDASERRSLLEILYTLLEDVSHTNDLSSRRSWRSISEIKGGIETSSDEREEHDADGSVRARTFDWLKGIEEARHLSLVSIYSNGIQRGTDGKEEDLILLSVREITVRGCGI